MRRSIGVGLAVGVTVALIGAWLLLDSGPSRVSDDPNLMALAAELVPAEGPVDGAPGARPLPRVEAARLARALAADPDDHDAWLGLVSLAAREGAVQRPGPVQSAQIVELIGEIDPGHPGLPAARAWLALQRGDLALARAALGPEPVTLQARAAALEIAQRLGEDPTAPADALLAVDPGHPDACVARARGALAAGDLARAASVAEGCRQAGATRPELHRVSGEVWWALDRPDQAADSWAAAGLTLHAAAAAGLAATPDWRERAAAAVAPVLGPDPAPTAASVQAIWLGLRADEAGWVRAGIGRLQAALELDPTSRQALAAGLLHTGQGDAARAALDGLDGGAAEVLRARALESQGDHEGALRAAERATAASPHEAWAWRARLALDPTVGDLLLARDPLTTALSREVPAVDCPGDLLSPSVALDAPEVQAAVAPLRSLGATPPPDPVAAQWWSARLDRPLPGAMAEAASPRLRAWWARERSAAPPELRDDSLPGRLLAAWAGEPAEGDQIVGELVREHPGVAGPLRERYLLGVRRSAGNAPSP